MSATLNNLLVAARIMAELPQTMIGGGHSVLFQLENWADLDRVREQYFSEPASCDVFDWMLQYRALSSFFGMPIPAELTLQNTPYTPEAWRKLEERAKSMTRHAKGDYLLDRIDTWLLECYSLKGRCEAGRGDVVLDCGTFSGNTSLYFSQKVGPEGRVYGFEPGPDTFVLYKKNVRALANVVPIEAAVAARSGTLSFEGNSPGAHVSSDGSQRVAALSLDDMVRDYRLDRVDFIKMDVEGAEHAALYGARDCIRRFRPKMALSAYHKENDCIVLPDTVEAIAPGAYDFALRHFSDCLYETVLYCIPRGRDEPGPTRSKPGKRARRGREKQLADLIPLLLSMMNQSLSLFSAARTAHLFPDIQQLQAMVDRCNKALAMAAETQKTNRDLTIENKALRKMLAKMPKTE